MNTIFILGELNKNTEGYYQIKFRGAFFEWQVKNVHLGYKKKFKSYLGKVVLIKANNVIVKNKEIYCIDYNLIEIT